MTKTSPVALPMLGSLLITKKREEPMSKCSSDPGSGLNPGCIGFLRHLDRNKSRCHRSTFFFTSYFSCDKRSTTKKCFPSLCGRFWRGLYNRFDRGMHPRQSVEDYLSAIQEETQQLEEQLASHKRVRDVLLQHE